MDPLERRGCEDGARGAEAVEEEFVTGELEALGDGVNVTGEDTAGEIVDAAAVTAMEVVVMAFAGDFVAGGLAGNFDRGEPAIGNKGVDVAIDRGNADALHDALGGGEGLVWRQGARGLLEGGANGVFLASFAESEGRHTWRVSGGRCTVRWCSAVRWARA